MSHVLLVDPIDVFNPYDVEREQLRAAGFGLSIADCQTPAEVIERAGDVEVIWIMWLAVVTPEVMDALPSLRLIVRWGVGYDQIDVPAATARGIAVSNAPTYGTDDVAEHAVALLLAWAHRVPQMDASMHAGIWPAVSQYPIHRLRGRTLGIVGLGRIGSGVARRARGLGLRVLACDPALTPEDIRARDCEPAAFEDLLAASDYVTVHVPLWASTLHLIDATALARMQPDALLVNTSRGPVIDEPALIEALTSGRLAGAALDVFDVEPLAADSPLRGLPQVILTPHSASYSREAWNDLRQEMCDTAISFLATSWATSIVNPEVRASLRLRNARSG
jgi:D-3-phosphoglycerate dehydrogenase